MYINGLETNLECVLITFNHRFSMFKVCCGLLLIWKPYALRRGHSYLPQAATNFKHPDWILPWKFIWAKTWQNQQSDCAPSEDSEQPGHSPSLIGSSLSAWRKLGSLATHWAHSKGSDQTGRMPRLIRVFAGQQALCWFCHVAAHLIHWKHSDFYESIK